MTNWPYLLQNLPPFKTELIINLLISLLVLIILVLIRRAILRLAFRRREDIKIRYNWRKFTGYVMYFLLAIFLLPLWVRNGIGLTTYLGLISAGIAIALKDLLTNLAGWVFILWRHPFRVGDRIQIDEFAGDVIDLRIFQFSLMEIGNWVNADQSTGRIIHVPNGMLFSAPLANYSHAFNYIWNELPLVITFESDWESAKEILLTIAKKHSAKAEIIGSERDIKEDEYLIFYKHLTPMVYTRVVERGVELTIRYLCDPRKRRGSAQAIWEETLQAFAERDDIRFAYPTYRLADHPGF